MSLSTRQIIDIAARSLGAKHYEIGDRQGLYLAEVLDEDSVCYYLDAKGKWLANFDPCNNNHDAFTLQVFHGISLICDHTSNQYTASLHNYSFIQSWTDDRFKAARKAITQVVVQYYSSIDNVVNIK